MTAIRSLIAQRHLAALLCVAALLLKLVIPSGYMIGEAQGHMAIVLCPGTMPVADAMSHAPPGDMTTMHGMPHGVMADHGRSDHRDGQHGRAEMPCAFAGLSAAALAAVDPIQLVALLAFVLTTGFVALTANVRPAPPYLRPPLRGPPALS
ncbi:hypothetical protein [Sphingomonas pseudosanguinis]|uniref:DUF2946 domain-containing protein n=1 Tax=Sphingomonas pseudosanguinis TaxID=413712 RepID=A0A7W6ABY0_9SPHN|nr:hypothetical protein [Sphingomonas pseudosanguinis]MBN3535858.1 hypothetical protein [Sphingomonas pseudosanguinis]